MSRSRRLRLAVLAATLVAVPTVPWSPGGLPAASAAACGPAPSGWVAVAVVVDNGTAPATRCVEVPERSTGYDVLIAAGHTLRVESGFLCAIDGVPATGCGNRPDFGGAYWRYFHAAPGGSWTYSTVGGGGYRVPSRCAVEGWRWSDASTTATTPRVAPPAVTCEAPPPTTSARPAPAPVPLHTSPPAAAAQPPATPAMPAPGSGVTPQQPAAGIDAAPGAGAGTGATGGGVAPADGADVTAAGPSADARGSGPTPPSSDEDAGQSTSGPGPSPGVVGRADDDDAAPEAEVLAGSLGASEPVGSPLGVLVGVAAILALAVAALVRSVRRRSGGTAVSGADRVAVHEEF